jgi:23S rRNA (cytidine1920-2'-O)/16S rRNA (cytidine1409-2'-O)-methyltransferase
VGQSTGGFTDCLLQQGAARVVGVDVGFGQLHDKLRSDERVLCFERVNAREPGAIATEIAKLLAGEDEDESDEFGDNVDADFDDDNYDQNDAVRVNFNPKNIATKVINTPASDLFEPDFLAEFDFIVGDLSFISQTLVLPAIAPLLKPNGCLVMLVKPQFELNFGQVGKGGIVREVALYEQVEKRIREAYVEQGLTVHAWLESPIQGGDGNREFFIHASKIAEAVTKEVKVKSKAATKAKVEPKADTKTK